jgi:hypothetical protein
VTVDNQNAINQKYGTHYAVTTKDPKTKATLYLSFFEDKSPKWTVYSEAALTLVERKAIEWAQQYGGTAQEVVPF